MHGVQDLPVLGGAGALSVFAVIVVSERPKGIAAHTRFLNRLGQWERLELGEFDRAGEGGGERLQDGTGELEGGETKAMRWRWRSYAIVPLPTCSKMSVY